MTYIVTGDCVDCVYTSCVDECPVAAFHDAEDKLLINPDTCIDCDACGRVPGGGHSRRS